MPGSGQPTNRPAIAALVNAAYAIEASFVEGDRTSAAEIAAMLDEGTFLVLDTAAGLGAAVYVQPHGYIGMLSVQPALQGHGLGKRMVRIAEAVCEAAGCETVALRIIHLREELGRRRRGRRGRRVPDADLDCGVVAVGNAGLLEADIARERRAREPHQHQERLHDAPSATSESPAT